jgi:hypothetical protein
MELLGNRQFQGVQTQGRLVRRESGASKAGEEEGEGQPVKPATLPVSEAQVTDHSSSAASSTQQKTEMAQLKAELSDKSTDG